MTRRLMRDAVIRGRLGFAFGAAMLLISTMSYSQDSMARETAVALSAMLTAYIALGLPFYLLNQREVTQLPVKRRHFWRARVICSVAFPLAIGLPAKMAGLSLGTIGGAWPTASDAVLSSLIDVIYCLSLLGVVALWPVRFVPYEPKQRRMSIVGMIVFAAAFLSPLIFKAILPSSWDRLDARASVLLGVWGVLGATAIWHRPQIAPRPEKQILRSRKTARFFTFRSPGDGLTGLSMLWWVHAQEVVLVAPFAFAMIGFIASLTAGTASHSTRELVHRLQLMPFDVEFPFDGRRGFNVIVFAFVVGNTSRELIQRARALRILPMTSVGLSMTFGVLAVSTAAVVWIYLVVIHVAVVGSLPATLKPDMFVIFTGGLVLSQAMESVFPSPIAGRIFGLTVFVPTGLAIGGFFTTNVLALFIAGGVAFAAGLFLHAWLFRRRQSIYKFKPLTLFGKPMPS